MDYNLQLTFILVSHPISSFNVKNGLHLQSLLISTAVVTTHKIQYHNVETHYRSSNTVEKL